MRQTLLAAAFLLASVTGYGQVAEFSFGGGANTINGGDLGSGYSLEGGYRFGFRLTLNNWRFLGHEFGYGYNRLQFRVEGQGETGTAAHQGFYNMLAYATPEGSRVRPFVTGGGHFANYAWPGYSALQGGGSTKFGLNYGGGIKARITEAWWIRADVRQYWNGKPFTDFLGGSGSLRQNEISVGLFFGL